jgi:hypothetical protein
VCDLEQWDPPFALALLRAAGITLM